MKDRIPTWTEFGVKAFVDTDEETGMCYNYQRSYDYLNI